ncbi:hypothetical protein [Streptomyces sp. ME19-01-6]|nr:hypothetical protein [Streptomyces sp. ME19-01-6]MDX3231805.1 hypothetical protein [Streptomyces sp. ME19-01-6]
MDEVLGKNKLGAHHLLRVGLTTMAVPSAAPCPLTGLLVRAVAVPL